MDLTLSRRGDYALRAAIALGLPHLERGAFLKAREISERMAIPRSFTAQILGVLIDAGLVEARAGRDGGYRLRREPGSITVLEVIEAAEGQLTSRDCPMRGGPCRWNDACAVHATWTRASDAVRAAMRGSTIAGLAAEDARLAARAARSRARTGRPQRVS